jgi:hypothetical protein
MQHGTPQRVSAMTARPRSRRQLHVSLRTVSHVASHVFQTISQYLVTPIVFFSTTSSAPNTRQFVTAHISERTRIPSGSRGSRRGRMVS